MAYQSFRFFSVIYPGYHVVGKGLVPGPCESGRTWAHVHRSFVYPQPTSPQPFYPYPPLECMCLFAVLPLVSMERQSNTK